MAIDQELLEGLKSTWESQFKPTLDEMKAEIAKHGESTGETEQKLAKVNEALDDYEVRFQKLAEQIEADQRKDARMSSPAWKAFEAWLRKGTPPAAELLEQKVLIASDDTDGGFLAPDEFVGEIVKGIVLFSPMREVARVRSTSSKTSRIPKRTGTFAAAWTGDQQTRSETTGLSYGLEEIPNHELYALVDVSQEDLEDSYFDLEAELMEEAREQFGVAEGAAFVSGNAVKKPEGFLTNSDVIAGAVHSGDASLLTANGILSLSAGLKSGYVRNARWLLNRATLYAIRKLQDQNNQYLWTPQFGASLVGGPPALIDGMPYVEMPDMPDVASNAYPLALGDFKKSYIISDRVVMQAQRDPYTQATSGNVRFIFRKRVGGQVVLPEAIKIQKVAS